MHGIICRGAGHKSRVGVPKLILSPTLALALILRRKDIRFWLQATTGRGLVIHSAEEALVVLVLSQDKTGPS